MRLTIAAGLALAAFAAAAAIADDRGAAPLPTPLTRPEMKQALEDLKDRKIRIPLPELTDADRQALGDRADNYETRLRFHYLPGGQEQRGGFNREPDPKATLSYEFKTMLFWIVSRTNNCLY